MTKYSNFKDFNLRNKLKKNQMNTFILKSFLFKEETSKKMRFKIMLKMHKMYHNLLGNKFKNRCVFSTKIRSVSRLVNLTKSTFRETLRWGKLNGFRKASW